MATGELGGKLWQFPRALGGILTHPGKSLSQIEARERGGVSLALGWAVLAVVTTRLPALADAIAGFEAGGGLRILSVFTSELARSVPPVLIAALLLVILAGSKRDPAVDLELGAASVIPLLVVRAGFATITAVSGLTLDQPHVWVVDAIGAVWSLWPFVLSLRLARRRPAGRGPEPTGAERLRAVIAGLTALGVLGVALAGGIRFVFRNHERLGPVSAGQPAPDFTLGRIDVPQGVVTLSSLRGKVVVLDFWATWCPPCIAMMPWVHDLQHRMGPRGVAVVGVNEDGEQSTRDEVASFLRNNPPPYPVVYDDGGVGAQYRVRALPTLVVIGRDGQVDRVLVGMVPKAMLEKAVTAALER